MNKRADISPDDLRPPAQIEVYVRILGVDDAVRFLLEFGGAELHYPKRATARSRLAKVLGIQKANALLRERDRFQARVPLAKGWVAAVLRSKGLPVAEIARRLRMSDVSVRAAMNRYQVGPPKDDKQRDLFD